LVVDERAEPEGDVGIQQVGGGDYAVTTHYGPYNQLGDTYARLCGQWLPSSGRELRWAPSLEFYRNSPHDTPPEKLVTDIFMPLED
jgi:AraC family transcriptional regulator